MKTFPFTCILGPLVAISAGVAPTSGQTTELVSVSSTGEQANDISITNSDAPLSLSADGRFVAFNSRATNLVLSDTNDAPDVFVRDLALGTTERVSISSSGAQGNPDNSGRGSYATALSGDGRFVAFNSYCSNLVSGDTGGLSDVFVHDRLSGVTERVSLSTSNKSPNGASLAPSISADGRYVLFHSGATNLVGDDRNKRSDVFLRDRLTGITTRVSVGTGGVEANGGASLFLCGNALSADGRTAVFISASSNLVAGDSNGKYDAFVRDLLYRTTTRVSVGTGGFEADGDTNRVCLSADGRFVAFNSNAQNLKPAGTPPIIHQLYVRDLLTGTTTCASVSSSGEAAKSTVSDHAAMSADGRYVAFMTIASNLVPGDVNGLHDVFVRDLVLGTTRRVSTSGSTFDGTGLDVAIDSLGTTVVFPSFATDLVPGDINGVKDIFVVR